MPKPIASVQRGPYSIRALAPGDDESVVIGPNETVAEILIYGAIGEGFLFEETVTARDFVADLASVDADRLIVRINSEGGSVPDGIAIYNALRRHPARVETENDGMALSIASMILMAGDVRRMASNTRLMVHAPWAMVVGNARDLRQQADQADEWADAMAQAFLRAAGNDNADMINQIHHDGEDHWFSATQAMAAGFITEVTGDEVQMAARYDFRHINNVPAAAAAYSKKERPMGDKTNTGGKTHTPETETTTDTTAKPNAAQRSTQAEAGGGNTPAATATGGHNEGAAAARAIADFKAAESARRKDIRAAFKPFAGYTGVTALESECLDDIDITSNVARDKLMAHLGSGAEPLGAAQNSGAFEVTGDEVDRRRQGKTQALLARMGGIKGADGKVIAHDPQNPHRGQTLREMARASLGEVGMNVQGMDDNTLAQNALSWHVMAAGGQTTSDFPVILEDAIRTIMLMGFNARAAVWDQFCKTGSVSDFKEYRRLVPALLGGFDRKNEAGEYKNKNLADAEGEKIAAEEYGNIITVSRKVLINDDIGYIQSLANGLGMAGKRGIDTTVFNLLAANPTMSDGSKLFSAAHKNLGTPGAPSTAAMLELADLMAVQKAPGKDAVELDIAPSVGLANRGNGRTIRTINDAQFDVEVENKYQVPNQAQGLLDNVVQTSRLGAEWYFFADPNLAPAIEVVFLNGQTEPALIQEEAFRTGSLSWRPTLDYGVGAIDYRGAAKNAGAS